jgi:hypothetical protein
MTAAKTTTADHDRDRDVDEALTQTLMLALGSPQSLYAAMHATTMMTTPCAAVIAETNGQQK